MTNDTYIKLYTEILDDPKMSRLTDKQWRLTIELFLLTVEYDDQGVLPSLAYIAWRLRINEKTLLKTMNELEQVGILITDGYTWMVPNWIYRRIRHIGVIFWSKNDFT